MQPVVKINRKPRNTGASLQPRPISNKHTLITLKRQREYMQQLQNDGLYCALTTVKSPAPPENPIGKTISPPPSLEEEDSEESGCSSFSEDSDEGSDTENRKPAQRKKSGKDDESKKPKPPKPRKTPERPPSVFVCLRSAVASFGRSPDNSGLVLPDPFVSQRHFQVLEENGQFCVSDQGSMNGTFLRKKCDYTKEGRVLTHNSIFVIGQTEFQVSSLRDQTTTLEELAERKIPSTAGIGLKLNFKHKTAVVENKSGISGPDVRYRQANRCVLIKSTGCVIGRAADCLIRLVDETVDMHQAEIFLSRHGKFYIRNATPDTAHGFWTRLSPSSTVSPQIVLEDGDVIKVGASELIVEIRSRPSQPKILFPKNPPSCAIDIGTAVDGNWLKQKEMQDRLIVIDNYGGVPSNGFFGIFDGHQERRVADFAAAALHQNLLDEIEQATKGLQSRVRFCPSSPVTIIPNTPPSSPSPDSHNKPSFFDLFQKNDPISSPPPSSSINRSGIKPPFTVPSSPSILEPTVDPKGKIIVSAPGPLQRYPFTPPPTSRNLNDMFNPPNEEIEEDIRKSAPQPISLIYDLKSDGENNSTPIPPDQDNDEGLKLKITPHTSPVIPHHRRNTPGSKGDSESIATTSTSITGSIYSEESRSDSGTGVSLPDCLVGAYEKTTKQIEGLGDISRYGGSTALTCVLWKDEKTNQTKLYTANIGDSRAVLCRDGKAVALSYDHVARDPTEQARVKARGGIIRNNQLGFCLEVSRAFGDRGLIHYGLTSDPHISEAVIGPKDEFMLLASDGLWDVFSNREAVDFVKKILADKTKTHPSCDEIARILLTKAINRLNCNDNLSLVIVRFKPEEIEIGSSSTSSTPQIESVESHLEDNLISSSASIPIRTIALSPPSPRRGGLQPQNLIPKLPLQKYSSAPTLRSPDLENEEQRHYKNLPSETLEIPLLSNNEKNQEIALNNLLQKRLPSYNYRITDSGSELSDIFSPSSPPFSPLSPSMSPTSSGNDSATA